MSADSKPRRDGRIAREAAAIVRYFGVEEQHRSVVHRLAVLRTRFKDAVKVGRDDGELVRLSRAIGSIESDLAITRSAQRAAAPPAPAPDSMLAQAERLAQARARLKGREPLTLQNRTG